MPRQNQYEKTSKLEETLTQFIQVSFSNHKSIEASIKSLEFQNAHSTTRTSPNKSISYIASTNWKSQPQHKHKPKEELPGKKTRGVHPDTDALC